MATMYEKAKAIKQKLVELRRAIHQNPETSFEEFYNRRSGSAHVSTT